VQKGYSEDGHYLKIILFNYAGVICDIGHSRGWVERFLILMGVMISMGGMFKWILAGD
jgi:hypothetical protein